MSEDKYKNFTPEIVEYDEDVDGSDEFKTRDKMLDEKDKLIDIMLKLKAKQRGPNKTRR